MASVDGFRSPRPFYIVRHHWLPDMQRWTRNTKIFPKGYNDWNFRGQNFKLDFLKMWNFFAPYFNILLRAWPCIEWPIRCARASTPFLTLGPNPQKFEPPKLRTGSRYRLRSNGIHHRSSSTKMWCSQIPPGCATTNFCPLIVKPPFLGNLSSDFC